MLRAAFVSLLLTALPAVAQLEWEKPWQEFQRSPEDGHLETTFSFKNTGTNSVAIKSIKTSCGCTTARLEKKVYAPGERGEITTKFSFGGRKGAQRKLITVKSDDGRIQELNFVVFIREALSVSPALVFWKVGQPAETRVIQLQSSPGTTVRIKSVSSSNPRLAPTLRTIKPGAEYTVSVQPTDTAQKEAAQLTVLTDFPPDAPRSYTIHARIK